jgi:glutamate N-acetyltransferase/amino-acid N-acetyltransferase
MAYKTVKGGVCAPQGFLGAAVSCGVKNPKDRRTDLALIYSEHPCVSAGTFTTNRVKAAPVKVTQAHLRSQELRAIVANSGNANACTGVHGIEDALPMDRITPGLALLPDHLHSKGGTEVAKAIMTSDTTIKEIAITTSIGGQKVRIGACAKGAGMICPSMATMLCFVTTDANLSKTCLQKTILEAVEGSFNRICIDGDMSTNDTVLVLANGQAGGPRIARGSKACREFREALQHVLLKLAQSCVKDGERIRKFVTLEVRGASTYLDAKKVAEAVAKSALVKASWNGDDPNWGRIIHAVGYSRARIREELIDISYEDKPACEGGLMSKTPHKLLRDIAARDSFTITVNLHQGKADYTIYTTDLSPEYIDFNRSEYSYWKNSGLG